MPAQTIDKTTEVGSYFHVFNKGVDNRIIFADSKDYETFVTFLKDYLDPPLDKEKAKTTFNIKGRTFRGVPHLPKNYFNKIKLIAYSLHPNHFHLLLHEVESGSIQSFVRSFCTRYSMYFNKRYNRTGSLFAGPYKSAKIKDLKTLTLTTSFIHYSASKRGLMNYSSLPEYSGVRQTSFIETKIISSYTKESSNYKNFLEKDDYNDEEKDILKEIIFENISEHIKEIDSISRENNSPKNKIQQSQNIPWIETPKFILLSSLTFLVLFGAGLRNIKSYEKYQKLASLPISPTQAPIAQKTETISTPSVLGENEPDYQKVKIKINDNSESVNIRKAPSTKSEIIAKAQEGDTYLLLSEEEDWYGIKLEDGSFAYVSKRYAEILEGELEGEDN